ILNLYGGPGTTDVYIDDLEAGPLTESRQAPEALVPVKTASRRNAEVQLRSNQLSVSGQRFFPRIIRFSGTPLSVLHQAGFNAIWLDDSTAPSLAQDAADLGFLLVPALQSPYQADPSAARVQGTLTANDSFKRKLARYLDQEAVLWWDLGNN